jgi:hypothetical protein
MDLSPSREATSCGAMRVYVTFRKTFIFYGEELLAPRQNPKLQDHPLSVVFECLFNIVVAMLHSWRPSPPSVTTGLQDSKRKENSLPRSSLEGTLHRGVESLSTTLRGAGKTSNTLLRFQPRARTKSREKSA